MAEAKAIGYKAFSPHWADPETGVTVIFFFHSIVFNSELCGLEMLLTHGE